VELLSVWPGKIQLREAEVDCDLPLLFLGQPIRVGSRERFYQRAFAVIDMAGSGQDEMFVCHFSPS
jgi:hypothetical protein